MNRCFTSEETPSSGKKDGLGKREDEGKSSFPFMCLISMSYSIISNFQRLARGDLRES